MREVTKRSVIPVYAVAAVWLIYSLLFPLYRLWHFIICAAITIAVYVLARRLFPGTVVMVKDPVKPPDTGNVELNKFISEGRARQAELRALNVAITNPVISKQLDELEDLTEKIFRQVEQDPKKMPEIRRFLNYYLPTTLKLLSSYDRMSQQGVSGENINSTMKKIERMMETIIKAYRHQLDALFESEAMDISADISVLETMMTSEGINDDFKSSGAKTEKEAKASADEDIEVK